MFLCFAVCLKSVQFFLRPPMLLNVWVEWYLPSTPKENTFRSCYITCIRAAVGKILKNEYPDFFTCFYWFGFLDVRQRVVMI